MGRVTNSKSGPRKFRRVPLEALRETRVASLGMAYLMCGVRSAKCEVRRGYAVR